MGCIVSMLDRYIILTYWVLGLLYLAAVIGYLWLTLKKEQTKWSTRGSPVCLALLLVGPPAWFIFQYYYLYMGSEARPPSEHFKYGQELASRVWAAFSAFALAVALKKKPGE